MKKKGIILILLAAMIALVGCIGNKDVPKNDAPKETAIATPTAPNVTASITSVRLETETVKCELCHTNSKVLNPHVNGGKFCVNCHGSQVHSIHIGEGTVNLKCDSCHGFPPKVPTIEIGEGPGHYSVCEKCHAPPPDSLKLSMGNLVDIHLSRAKYCTNCHGTDIGVTHKAALNRAKK